MKRITDNRQQATKLIVALDVESLKEAQRLVRLLYPTVKIFKVGFQLFTAAGAKSVEVINKIGAKVFLDLKFYDIPNTVANAVRQATKLNVFMLDVHVQGGEDMLKAAVQAARSQARISGVKPPLLLGITVLTSQKGRNIKEVVLKRARMAKECGLNGVVASVWEAPLLRKSLTKNFLIVTPGIRLKQNAHFDQKRVATAGQAVSSGSDYLVVGRPIIQAKDPLKVVKDIVSEISSYQMKPGFSLT